MPITAASLGERFGAFLIDGFIVGSFHSVAVISVVGAASLVRRTNDFDEAWLVSLSFVVLWSVYALRAFRSRWCTTEGMHIVKIETAAVDGTAPTALRAVARSLCFGTQLAFAMDVIVPLTSGVAPWSAVLVVAANLAALLVTPKHQTIHDWVSGTVVVRAPAPLRNAVGG